MNEISEQKSRMYRAKQALLDKMIRENGKGLSSQTANLKRQKQESPPLSFSQQRLWFLDQLEPGSSAYNMPLAIRLTGRLKVAGLQQSLGEILRRHEVLRTTFITEHDRPVQRIAPVRAFTLPQIDLSALSEEQREAKARELASEEASRSFDLTAGPLLRATLLQLAPEEHVLLVTMHHIISDGWSMGIFYRELSALYEAFSQGKPSPFPELPIQYADFAVWQRQWLQGKELEEQLMFWKEQLRNISTLELPTDRPRPSVQTFCGAVHTVEFPKSLTEALWGLSRKEGVTLFMTLLAGFQSLLHRYTGQEDIVVGTPIANRNRAEIEGLIGFFVNTLVMRTDTSGDPAFRELLKRVRKTALGAYAHQDLPFEKLIMELQPERDLSRNPLIQVMFALQNFPFSDLDLTGLAIGKIEIKGTSTKFDLEIYLRETEEGLKGELVYNTDLFDSATIERMAGHYQMMLEGIVADPDQRLSELPLLTEAERHQLLVEWNDTEVEYPRDKCVHELFEEQVERTPDAIAVVFEDQQLTYRQLNSRANQLAHYLMRKGVGPEVLVGICVERSLEMVIGILGILKAGGAYVPLDPTYPKERLSFVISDIQAPLILTQGSLVRELPHNKAQVLCVDHDWKIIDKESTRNPSAILSAQNLAYVLYTSGSTGRPKGVAMNHRPLCNLISWQIRQSRLPAGARTQQFASLSFDVSFQEIFSTWCSGGTLMLISEEARRDPGLLLKHLASEAVERLFLPFVALQQLAEVADEPGRVPHNLREVITAGEQLRITPPITRMFERLRDCVLYNQYGPTESHVVTAFTLSGPPEQWRTLPPIGRPIANTEIYILDRYQQPVPAGVAGELHIGGSLARGYLNRQDLTAEKFIANPCSKEPGALLYRTGDLARYLPDGNIEFLGRMDHQTKIRGFRIEIGEVEAVLGLHPSVHETVVIAREDQTGNKQLVAYVVLNKQSATVSSDLRSFLKEKLPDYMIPSAFVILDALPLTPSGKVDRKALTIPDHSMTGMAKTYVAPRNTNEAQLTRIWEKVLAIQPIGVTDNFFELGGHSLLAVRLIAEIKKVTGKNLPVVALFQSPTVEQLVRALQKEGWSETFSLLMNIQPGGAKPPLFWMQGQYSTLLPRFLDPDQPLYVPIHQGLDGLPVLHRTVEAMASLYMREIRIVQKKGPYFLGGYCIGGLVALEIAQQLLKQGYEVPLLFLVEPPSNCFPHTTLHIDPLPENHLFQSRVTYHLSQIERLRPVDKLDYIRRKLPSAFNSVFNIIKLRFMGKFKILACKAYLMTGYPLPLSLRYFYLMYISESAVRNYTPKLYQGRVVLCYSDLISSGLDECSLPAGGAKVHAIDGSDHESIVKEPYVGTWVGHLNSYLRELQAKKEDTEE